MTKYMKMHTAIKNIAVFAHILGCSAILAIGFQSTLKAATVYDDWFHPVTITVSVVFAALFCWMAYITLNLVRVVNAHQRWESHNQSFCDALEDFNNLFHNNPNISQKNKSKYLKAIISLKPCFHKATPPLSSSDNQKDQKR